MLACLMVNNFRMIMKKCAQTYECKLKISLNFYTFLVLSSMLIPVYAHADDPTKHADELKSALEEAELSDPVRIEPLITRITNDNPHYFNQHPELKSEIISWASKQLNKENNSRKLLSTIGCLAYIGGGESADLLRGKASDVRSEFQKLQTNPDGVSAETYVNQWFRHAGTYEEAEGNTLPFLNLLSEEFKNELNPGLHDNISAILGETRRPVIGDAEFIKKAQVEKGKVLQGACSRIDSGFKIAESFPELKNLMEQAAILDLFTAVENLDVEALKTIASGKGINLFPTREEPTLQDKKGDEKNKKKVTPLMVNASNWMDLATASGDQAKQGSDRIKANNKKVLEVANILLADCIESKKQAKQKDNSKCEPIDFSNAADGSALVLYSWAGSSAIVKNLLELGANVEQKSELHGNALSAAAVSGDEETFEIVYEYVKKIDDEKNRKKIIDDAKTNIQSVLKLLNKDDKKYGKLSSTLATFDSKSDKK